MAIGVVNNESSVALTVESTEGTYNGGTATSTDYVEVLAEGTTANKTREELTRDTLSSTVENESSRVGMAEVVAELPTEFGASATAGAAPQRMDKMLRSLLGGKRTAATDTTTTGNSSTVLEFGATPNFLKGDIVLVKEAGAFEVRPISAVGATTITFPFALDNGSPSDGVVVEACTTYFHDTSSSVTLSMEHNVGNEIQQQVAGLRAKSMSIENWTAGQIPTANFSLDGVKLSRVDSAQTATPDFTADALPPVALEACLYVNGNKLAYSELGMTIENTVSFLIDACEADGKAGSRITNQSVSFNCKKYSDDTTLVEWNNFENNDDATVFFFAFNPSSTAGEGSEYVAAWLPQGKITAAPFGDQDGIATDDLEIKAHKSSGNDSVFLGFV